MQEAPIRCAVLDDHEALRAGLTAELTRAGGIEVVGQAAGGRAGLELIERRRPDVAVVDLLMPEVDGIAVCRSLADAGAWVPVLVYADSPDVAQARAALDAGARGYVLKSGPMSDVVRAVRLLAAGRTYVESTLVTALLAAQSAPRSLLSERETEVLQLLADGLTTDRVARTLFLSPATVRSYAEAAMAKLDSRNRTHAVAAALREGLIA